MCRLPVEDIYVHGYPPPPVLVGPTMGLLLYSTLTAMFNLLSALASHAISATISLLMGTSTNISVLPAPVEYGDVSVIKHWSDDYIPVYEIRAAQTATKQAAYWAAYEEAFYDTYGMEPASIPTPVPSTRLSRQEARTQERVQAYEAVMSSYNQFPVTEHLNTGCYGTLQVHEGIVQKQDKRGDQGALLEREYAVLCALQDTGLVPGQVSFSNGVLSMEYIHAASLDYYQRCMEVGVLDYIQYTSILDAVGTAVKAFHAAGWVHNDLHPGNILITLEGGEWRAILIDVAFSTSATHSFPKELGMGIFRSGWKYFDMSQEGDIDSLKCHIKVPYLDRVFS